MHQRKKSSGTAEYRKLTLETTKRLTLKTTKQVKGFTFQHWCHLSQNNRQWVPNQVFEASLLHLVHKTLYSDGSCLGLYPICLQQ
jgi:hypothetical protein